ncbi:helix-turn-helix transcriptional regulator [Polycladidibacter hongkongensis]|uniref:helix-turn-helix transcriptional regulator n=1 Tax=Polycladidibacter hongkongensis TaxID=1647556 RepID=UPI00155E830E|nr:helix-turn-helix transcriptional regulator [Pseudovibrio hongkongensis]
MIHTREYCLLPRTARTAANITQAEAADEINVFQGQYSKLEKNPENLRIDQAYRLAKMFRCEIHDLYYSQDATPKQIERMIDRVAQFDEMLEDMEPHGSILIKTDAKDFQYRISEGTAYALRDQLDGAPSKAEETGVLRFKTIDNKEVFFNFDKILTFQIEHQDIDQMGAVFPAWFFVELTRLYHNEFELDENPFPNDLQDLTPMQYCQRVFEYHLATQIDTQEAQFLMDQQGKINVWFHNAHTQQFLMDHDVAEQLLECEQKLEEDEKLGLIDLSDEGGWQVHFLNFNNVDVIEVPAFYWTWMVAEAKGKKLEEPLYPEKPQVDKFFALNQSHKSKGNVLDLAAFAKANRASPRSLWES